MLVKLRLGALLIGGVLFGGLIMAELPNTGLGYVLRPVVLWLAMYPFVAETHFRRVQYWLLLAIVVPLGIAFDNSGPFRPMLKAITLVVFLLSVVVLFGRQVVRMRRS